MRLGLVVALPVAGHGHGTAALGLCARAGVSLQIKYPLERFWIPWEMRRRLDLISCALVESEESQKVAAWVAKRTSSR